MPPPARAVKPPTELMFTIRPEPLLRMLGRAARVTDSRPNTLMSKTAADLLVGRLLDGTDQSAAGVVDEHVDPLEALDRPCDRLDGLSFAGHVELHREQPLGRPVERLLDLARIACRRDDGIAARQRQSGDLEAESA